MNKAKNYSWNTSKIKLVDLLETRCCDAITCAIVDGDSYCYKHYMTNGYKYNFEFYNRIEHQYCLVKEFYM